MEKSKKPLYGYTVLDLTWVYSGPYCTSLLLDMGADVIKVEGPKFGDHTRTFPPFKNGASGYCYCINRGKKSIAVNLKTEKGRLLLMDLVKDADFIVENYVPGVMDKMGLGYDTLKEINPKLIYGSIHGFGSWGPYASLPGVDPIAQAMGGLMSLSGYPGMPPVKTGPAVADAVAGVYLALGLLSALVERNRTGLGKKVEVSLMDAVFSLLEESIVRTSMTGNALPARGNTDPLGAPWDAFETSDGKWLMLCSLGSDRFDKIYRFIGREDIADSYQGGSIEVCDRRAKDLVKLNQAFANWAITRESSYLIKVFSEMQVPCGLVKTINELLEDPHLIARNMVVDINHPKLGQIKTFNMPVMFNNRSIGITSEENPLEPELGQHNKEVLKSRLKLKDSEIDVLYSEGVLWAGGEK